MITPFVTTLSLLSMDLEAQRSSTTNTLEKKQSTLAITSNWIKSHEMWLEWTCWYPTAKCWWKESLAYRTAV